MKKVLVTLSLLLTLGLGASAQSDAFFSYSDVDNQQRTGGVAITTPGLPGQGTNTDNPANPAPLGSGLLLLAGLGAAYALRRKND